MSPKLILKFHQLLSLLRTTSSQKQINRSLPSALENQIPSCRLPAILMAFFDLNCATLPIASPVTADAITLPVFHWKPGMTTICVFCFSHCDGEERKTWKIIKKKNQKLFSEALLLLPAYLFCKYVQYFHHYFLF